MDVVPPDPSVLIDVEHVFAATTAAQGMKVGFTEFAADDAIMFSPGAVNVKKFYAESEGGTALLEWEPIYAEIAASGDLGWTTGPWEYRGDPNAENPDVSGHYISIWQLQPDSSWKFVLDIGIAHGPNASDPPPPVLRALLPVEEGSAAEAKTALNQLEYTFSAAAQNEGMPAAYRAHAADDIRFYRSGGDPIEGKAALERELSEVEGVWTWEPAMLEVSKDGGLGYAHGLSVQTLGETARLYSYVHIWRKGANGAWELALDIHIPLPPKTEESDG